ncbi:type II toxin-antitoxin system RelE/ParE family toxin [Aequorivita lipolytica]|uniref:Type II toxin-antitoxin system RelE/ParE family toxin n=1 Tax=Aequorivita lipolytica TaxID=153267 RepID=A0A5C6YTN0_9FLAO|nr:type II toxin-antitoxin system RelE/ParE family toxin [Aequorivita lipolytica]TXD70392.1 type II toxin-antitoxin system RelE/ParE family toxin [Aequorivita lipolytica]SRX50822.1 hypothetical protein AEQU2_01300 [Aequorivita lipolytica]
MIYKTLLLPIAYEELDEAVGFYEAHKKGLGKDFLEEINSIYFYLLENPFTFRKNNKGYYEAVLKRFPILIIYEVKENTIYIGSFFHTSRNPKTKPE